MVKNLPTNAGDIRDADLIPGSGRSPEEGNGNLLQYSCLGNPMDNGAWRDTVYGVAKSWTRLNDLALSTGVFSGVSSSALGAAKTSCPSTLSGLSSLLL